MAPHTQQDFETCRISYKPHFRKCHDLCLEVEIRIKDTLQKTAGQNFENL